MKLTFRKRDVKDLSQLQALVAENAEAVEPGFRVIATGVNFGRSTVEVVGVDRHGTPALIALGFTGDDAMLFRMVEAYAWTLEYPESVRRFVPDGGGAGGWPPRVVFVAERLPESFLRKIRLLVFHAVNCFEFRCVEVNDATGFYLDPVDWETSAPPPAAPPAIPAAEPGHADGVGRQDPAPAAGNTQSSRWFGLLTPPSERPTLERSSGRAESPAPLEASIVPFAEDPAMPRSNPPIAPEPAAPTDAAEIADDREVAPAWRKFLEKLAGTLDLRPAGDVPTAAPAEKPATTPEPQNTPAVAHAEPSRNGWARRHEDPRQRALLDVVTLPANGELAPQWRKFLENAPLGGKFLGKPVSADAQIGKLLEKPAPGDGKVEKFSETASLDGVKIERFPETAPLGDAKAGKFLEKPVLAEARVEKLPETAPLADATIGKRLDRPVLDDSKIHAVREYLHHEFPMCTIYDFHEHERNTHVLQLQDSQGKVAHLAAVTVEFLETHGESELRAVLETMRLSQAMRQAGQAGVLVTPSGAEIQKH
jgi:hypothetical protein